MKERRVCFLWCEECCNRHWYPMNRLGDAGRAVSRSGTLRVAVCCESCRIQLAVGEEATAFTVDGGANDSPWEEEYLDLEHTGEAITGEAKEG